MSDFVTLAPLSPHFVTYGFDDLFFNFIVSRFYITKIICIVVL